MFKNVDITEKRQYIVYLSFQRRNKQGPKSTYKQLAVRY